jgi:ABC-2 type transport system permease protein
VIGLVIVGLPPPIVVSGLAGSVTLLLEAARLGFLVVSLLLAGALNYFLQMTIAMTAFWLEENEAFYWIFQKLSLVVGTLIPIEFLPEQAARLAVWTPFPYLSYAPARIMVAFSPAEALSLVARQALWVIVALVLARVVFAAGSRRLSVNGG